MIPAKEINEAYTNQKRFVEEEKKTRNISGYKAAVATKAAQQNLGLNAPLAGILFADGELKNKSIISLENFAYAKIETEIGFRLNDTITAPTNSESIKQYVSEIMPAFEIPDMTDGNDIPIPQMIANNTYSSHYLLGEVKLPKNVDPNACKVELFHNNCLISSAKGSDAMDNQWEALSAAINLSLEHGFIPQNGNVVITGALGKILKMEKGIYTANYGMLGKLHLEVK